jgi:hypothetical protein
MSDKYAPGYNTKKLVGGPYSNAFNELFGPATASSTSPATGEKIYYGKLPAGAQVNDLDFIWSDFGAGNTINVGFELDGTPASGQIVATDAAGVTYTAAQAAFWFSAKDISTSASGGRTLSTSLPIKFSFPVKIVGVQTGTVVGTPTSSVVARGNFAGPQ